MMNGRQDGAPPARGLRARFDKFFEGIDTRLHLPLLGHSVLSQTIGTLGRLTVVYRALELELPVYMLGLISGAFAFLPALLAITVGRILDRGYDAEIIRAGSLLTIGAMIGFLVAPGSALTLFAFTAIFGLGHMFIVASSQVITVRAAGAQRDRAFGNFLVTNAIGHSLGPAVLSVVTLFTGHPNSAIQFSICLGLGLLALGLTMLMAPAPKGDGTARKDARMPMSELLRTKGLITLLLISITVMTAVELTPVYLPLLGKEAGIAAFHIGMMLTIRSVVAMISRVAYARLVDTYGHTPLFMVMLLVSAGAFLAFALPLPLAVLYCAAVALGLGVGLAQTLSVTALIDLAPPKARGTTISLRILGNRLNQILLPILAGVLATATGAVGVFAVLAVWLVGSAFAVRKTR